MTKRKREVIEVRNPREAVTLKDVELMDCTMDGAPIPDQHLVRVRPRQRRRAPDGRRRCDAVKGTRKLWPEGDFVLSVGLNLVPSPGISEAS